MQNWLGGSRAPAKAKIASSPAGRTAAYFKTKVHQEAQQQAAEDEAAPPAAVEVSADVQRLMSLFKLAKMPSSGMPTSSAAPSSSAGTSQGAGSGGAREARVSPPKTSSRPPAASASPIRAAAAPLVPLRERSAATTAPPPTAPHPTDLSPCKAAAAPQMDSMKDAYSALLANWSTLSMPSTRPRAPRPEPLFVLPDVPDPSANPTAPSLPPPPSDEPDAQFCTPPDAQRWPIDPIAAAAAAAEKAWEESIEAELADVSHSAGSGGPPPRPSSVFARGGGGGSLDTPHAFSFDCNAEEEGAEGFPGGDGGFGFGFGAGCEWMLQQTVTTHEYTLTVEREVHSWSFSGGSGNDNGGVEAAEEKEFSSRSMCGRKRKFAPPVRKTSTLTITELGEEEEEAAAVAAVGVAGMPEEEGSGGSPSMSLLSAGKVDAHLQRIVDQLTKDDGTTAPSPPIAAAAAVPAVPAAVVAVEEQAPPKRAALTEQLRPSEAAAASAPERVSHGALCLFLGTAAAHKTLGFPPPPPAAVAEVAAAEAEGAEEEKAALEAYARQLFAVNEALREEVEELRGRLTATSATAAAVVVG